MSVGNSSGVVEFERIACLPEASDNAAIALRDIQPGERLLLRHVVYEFAHGVLEGHRFAVYRIEKGGLIRSWGQPFGIATRPIEPGEYLANKKILHALKQRNLGVLLPAQANFEDFTPGFELKECRFDVEQVAPAGERTFSGFARAGGRGIGTRNYVVLLGTDSLSGPFVRELSAAFANASSKFPNIDGVVPVAHTEGGSLTSQGGKPPLNLELTLRTLAGFVVHPNVGAVLMVDSGGEGSMTNRALREYCERNQYPLDSVLHHWHSRTDDNDAAFCGEIVRRWLAQLNESRRETVSLRGLKIGLQCGGSDAFSGITANPLIGRMAQETVALGGSANLAETDELMGAENYVLERVRDLKTAKAFLAKIERFQKWAGQHGHGAEGNPSGGNLFRGLYNITLKSLGAARKKSPQTRLDHVIDFAEPMREAGFYFMDSPGNDLESIAGQVAAGCNLILFATGNGSITNFPFVPTIKVMTTSARFEQLRDEMDFDAGRLLTGEKFEELAAEATEKMVEVISGGKTAGEIAGHSQAQIWREWRGGAAGLSKPVITGEPAKERIELIALGGGCRLRARVGEIRERVALVLPTSLCAGEVGRMIAARLNERIREKQLPFSRAVTLPHTEGCGNSGGESEALFVRTMIGYLTHPLVARALMLEHGCEKTHNDAFRNALRELDIAATEFGWRGIQADGGIESAIEKSLQWFEASPAPERPQPAGKSKGVRFALGLMGANPPSTVIEVFRVLATHVARLGGAVVIPHGLELWPGMGREGISLDYGGKFNGEGVFTMYCPTEDYLEILTGMGASGVEVLVNLSEAGVVPGNPLVPTIQLMPEGARGAETADLVYRQEESPETTAERLLLLSASIRAGVERPKSWKTANCGFQITRGYTGISL